MEIRKANKNDKKALSNLMAQVGILHSDNRPDIFKQKTMKDLEEWSKQELENEERIVIVAEEKSKVLGMMICKIRDIKEHINLKDTKVLSIDEICVDEKERGKGIGSILIEKAKCIAKELKCVRIELNCWEFNQGAMQFYKNIGFEVQRTFLEMDL